MGNVWSFSNKMDKLTVLTQSHTEYRECSLMCFTETWLHRDITDQNVSMDGFYTVWANLDGTESAKWKGGGLAVPVNSRWCNPGHITNKEQLCSPDVELLVVGLHPYHLRREIPHVIIVVLYIPPSANPTSVCSTIHTTILKLQTQHPSVLIIISGDFNHVTMDRVLPTFKQYVSCPPSSGQVRSQPGSPTTLLCASGEEEAYDHKDCKEVVGGHL